MISGVSEHLEKRHGVRIPPGCKGLCPFCRRNLFTIRRDDSVGKCFHPSCGRFVTAGSSRDDYRGSLYEILDKIKQDCHEYLLAQKGKSGRYAYQFLTVDRLMHDDVIRDLAEIGAVPKNYDVAKAFTEATAGLDTRRKDLETKITAMQAKRKQIQQRAKTEQEKTWEKDLAAVERQYEFLKEQHEVLHERLSSVAGWLAFFHTDAHHRVCSIRFRKASTAEKRFQSYTPSKGCYGLFGHSLFRPFQSENKQSCNRLLVVEGEFNLLQIHSLAIRAASGPTEGLGYANWAASVGSSTTLDQNVIAGLLQTPGAVRPLVVIQDNDDAGDGMVDALSQTFTLEIVKPPQREQDIDDFIRSLPDAKQASGALHQLIEQRSLRQRPYDALAKQVFGTRQKHGEEDERREFEINAQVRGIVIKDLSERGRFYHEHQQGYYFLGDEKKLIPLDDAGRHLSCLLERYGLNPSEKVFEYIREALVIESLDRGEATQVHRLSWFDRDTFVLYLFNHGNRVYRITADAVEEVDNGADGVLFVSDSRNEPFSLVQGDGLDDLFHDHVTAEVNFADEAETYLTREQQQALLDLWFLSLFFGSLMPTRAILAFVGPKGSGKSHTLHKIGLLLFGSRFKVKMLPNKEEAFDAVVTNSQYAAFDNVDSHVKWLPDRLAICATGGTVPKRVLYTTNDLADYPIDCFLGITSRTPHFKRDDVADRLLINRVKRIEMEGEADERDDAGGQSEANNDEGRFLAESALTAPLLKNRDRILTSVVHQLQECIGALKRTAGKEYRTSFRMADFATFCLRLADDQGDLTTMRRTFARMMEEQSAFSLDGDSLVEPLLKWLESKENHRKQVSAKDLYRLLSTLAEEQKLKFDYESPRVLGQRLGHIETNLRTVVNLTVSRDAHHKQKLYAFWPKAAVEEGFTDGPKSEPMPNGKAQGGLHGLVAAGGKCG